MVSQYVARMTVETAAIDNSFARKNVASKDWVQSTRGSITAEKDANADVATARRFFQAVLGKSDIASATGITNVMVTNRNRIPNMSLVAGPTPLTTLGAGPPVIRNMVIADSERTLRGTIDSGGSGNRRSLCPR